MESMPAGTGIVMVDHGSVRPEANEVVEMMAALYKQITGTAIVEPAHMELAQPSLEEAIDRCVAQGAERVVVSLYFLAPGRHGKTDIPRMAAEAASRHAGLEVVVTEPMGLDERLVEVLHERVLAAAGPGVVR